MKYSPKLRKMATRFEAECRKEGIPFIACFHDKDLQITEYVMSIDTKHNYLSLENGEIRVDSSEDVPVISRIEESIINGEIEGGRMVRNAGDENKFRASFSKADSLLGSSHELQETWEEGGTMATILDD